MKYESPHAKPQFGEGNMFPSPNLYSLFQTLFKITNSSALGLNPFTPF